MSDALRFDPSDRLPWLSDPDPARPQPRQRPRSWLPLVAAISAAGAIAFGGWSLVQRSAAPEPARVAPERIVPLPPPAVAPSADAEPQPPSASEREALRPAVRPPSAEPAAAARPRDAARTAAPRRRPARRATAPQPAAAAPKAAAPAYSPRAWNSGIPGRIIQVGAFASRVKADREWNRIYYRYTLLRPLPPRIVKSRIRGRTYYRLQLGTFSQAHSELLCQRLRATGERCIVLGLRGRR